MKKNKSPIIAAMLAEPMDMGENPKENKAEKGKETKKDNMTECPDCGVKQASGNNYCPHCGKKM